MSQQMPTTQTLADDFVAQVDGATDQTTPLLKKAFTRVTGKVLGGMAVLIYKYAGWSLLQQFVATASMRETTVLGVRLRPLVEHGRLIGVGDPLPASRAELTVAVKVLSTSATPMQPGTQVVNPTTGIVYLTLAPISLAAVGTVNATVRASSDQQGGLGEGPQGNLPAGATLQFASPPSNVARTVTVVAQTVAGAVAETEPAYRARVVRRAQRKPQGGALADYSQWGEELAGVVQVYVYRGDPGQVDVYVEATEDSSSNPDGIPTSGQLAGVNALIQLDVAGKATRRPTGAAVNVLPISRSPFNVRVIGLVLDDLDSGKADIAEAVDEYLRQREPFIVGLSVLPRVDRVTQAAISGIVDDVASALGGSIARVELISAGETISAYTLGKGELAKLGTITFI